jgi:hypothetical protein
LIYCDQVFRYKHKPKLHYLGVDSVFLRSENYRPDLRTETKFRFAVVK